MSNLIQNEIEALRLRAKSVGLTDAEEIRIRELANTPAETLAQLDALSARCDVPFQTTAVLAAFVRSGRC